MISKEQFVEVIEALQAASDFLDRSHDLYIDLYDIEPVNSLYKLESIIFKTNFTEEAIDVIDWWLYEYDKVEPAMWDADKNVIPMETVEDLWEYCKNYML